MCSGGGLDTEPPLADVGHVGRLFARVIAALRELLGDAVEARALPRDHPRRLVGRRGEDVAELRAAALEADRAGVGDIVRDDRHVGLGALEARKRRIECTGLILPGWIGFPATPVRCSSPLFPSTARSGP